jgi:hypothetical protein
LHKKKWLMLAINLLGGAAVLGSYAWGIRTHANADQLLWGGVPLVIRPFYTAGMFLAAAGYFAFTYFLLLRLPPDDTRVGRRFGFDLFNALYAGILIPSALWMPLTFVAIESSGAAIASFVRLVLALVAAASLGLLAALLMVEPKTPRWAQRLAVVGAAAFCLQTAVLDAVVWSAFFHV